MAYVSEPSDTWHHKYQQVDQIAFGIAEPRWEPAEVGTKFKVAIGLVKDKPGR